MIVVTVALVVLGCFLMKNGYEMFDNGENPFLGVLVTLAGFGIALFNLYEIIQGVRA